MAECLKICRIFRADSSRVTLQENSVSIIPPNMKISKFILSTAKSMRNLFLAENIKKPETREKSCIGFSQNYVFHDNTML